MTVRNQNFFIADPDGWVYLVNIEWDDDEDDDFSYEDAVSDYINANEDMGFSIDDCSWGVAEGYVDRHSDKNIWRKEKGKERQNFWIHDTHGWLFTVTLEWDTGDMSDALDEYIQWDQEIEGNIDQCSWGVLEEFHNFERVKKYAIRRTGRMFANDD